MSVTLEIFVQLIPAIVSALVASIATVRLSLRQFRSQWWWERKADTYSRIIGEMASLKMCLDDWFRDATHEILLSDERKSEIQAKYRQAREWVEQIATIGSFTISPEAALVITDLIHDLEQRDPDGDWVRDLDQHAASVINAINRMKEAARTDLALI